jgi:hypothetical protein
MPTSRLTRFAGSVTIALVVVLGFGGCISDRPAVAQIREPGLPAPVLCFGPRAPCGLAGPNHKTDELIVTARPLNSPDERGTVVWKVEAAPGFERGRAWFISYGQPPPGWHETISAAPLQPGLLYEFQNLRFVVEGTRIRRIRGRR